jgi:type IV pilus assembly protein PilA
MKSMKMMKKAQAGFTLIELMIVVAIIGILSAVAIPAYNDYTQKAQVSEAFSEVASMQMAIISYIQENGAYPTQQDIDNGIPASTAGKFSSAAAVPGTGVINVTMGAAGTVGADVATRTLTFNPPSLVGARDWSFSCTSTIRQKYLPKMCTGTS